MMRSSARAANTSLGRVSAAINCSTMASIAGSEMPARLLEPLVAAAQEEKYGRSESPGTVEKPKRSMIMSKSKSSPRAELHRIDQPQRRFDTERAQILDKGHVMGLERGFVEQKFNPEGFALRRHPLAVLHHAACFLKQLHRLAQQRPILPRPIRHRRHERLTEHLIRHLAAEWLKQCDLFRQRGSDRHHIRILER